MPVLLGLDVGTTNTKAVICDLEGRHIAGAAAPTPTEGGEPGQATHDPEALYQVVLQVIRTAMADMPSPQCVLAIAVSSMAEAGVPLDRHGQPVYPVIAWYDSRTLPYRSWWAERIADEHLFAITGLQPGHIFSLSKILWLREHVPAAYSRMTRWLSVSDYVAYRLCGEQAMSYSQACRTLAFDLQHLAWSEELLTMAQVPASLFPAAVPSGQVLGPVLPSEAAACGLGGGRSRAERAEPLVVAGGHDHPCAALAAGVVTPGALLDSIGTTEAVLGVIERAHTAAEVHSLGLSCGVHVVPGSYYLIGGLLGMGPLQHWLAETFLTEGNAADRYTRLAELAASSPAGANGLLFLPFLAGGGAPQIDPRATGCWLGLRQHHTRADLVRSALEGGAYELQRLLTSFAALLSSSTAPLQAVGGGARSSFGLQLRADVTGRLIEVPQGTERAALGAALLAGLGTHVYPDAETAGACTYRAAHTFQPDAARHALYRARYQAYLSVLSARTLAPWLSGARENS